MYILFTDETNSQSNAKSKFFIYGGVFFSSESAVAIHQAIKELREEAGLLPSDELKFDTRSRPKKRVSVEEHKELKKRVLQIALDHDVRFIANLVLHDLADRDNLISWGANNVIERFHGFLNLEDEHGIVTMDRVPTKTNGFDYIQEKFQQGLSYPYGRVSLSRVCAFTLTSVGASHLGSLVDIVLGSFRYCINEREKLDVPKVMLPDLVKLMWKRKVGKNLVVTGYGLVFSPEIEKVKALKYRQEYQGIKDHMNSILRKAGN